MDANKLGSTRNSKDGQVAPFVIERTFNAPAPLIWKALTDKNEMKKWYFDLEVFKPEVGFEFRFVAGDCGKDFMHLCKVTEVEAEKKLTYSWRYENFEGNSFVTFELLPEGKQTKLRLTHRGLESFPKDHPSFAKESFAKGWTEIIGTSLKEYLEK